MLVRLCSATLLYSLSSVLIEPFDQLNQFHQMKNHMRFLLGLCLLLLNCMRDQAAALPEPKIIITSEIAKETHATMEAILATVRDNDIETNPLYGEVEIRLIEQQIAAVDKSKDLGNYVLGAIFLGKANINVGNLEKGIGQLLETHTYLMKRQDKGPLMEQASFELGMAYLRLGETENCCATFSPDSCTLPLKGGAIHTKRAGSEAAIQYFTQALQLAANEDDRLLTQWLLNLAYMTLGDYPANTPEAVRLPESMLKSDVEFPHFLNISEGTGLGTDSLAGGAVADDFDGDGDIDLMVSSWDSGVGLHYFENRLTQGEGFVDRSEAAGITKLFGGLNMVQADYDNDGDVDVLILRGAWKIVMGNVPNSLLRNEGDGTFLDVSIAAGLTEKNYPTQTAAWLDYDNDGDLDIIIGNEQWGEQPAPSQLFRNNNDGTFTDVAESAGLVNDGVVKGVACGDLDNDRWTDIVISNFKGANKLYHNNGNGTFSNIAKTAGIESPSHSFPAWIWDFNNDGNLDVFISSYSGEAIDLAKKALGRRPKGDVSGHFQGNGNNRFVNMADLQGLDAPMLTMGCNFGDLNNDGYPDLYLGTGSPEITVLMPNSLFLNQGGKHFADVTMASGMGHLQKGHAIAFADFDGDGDQDIFEQMGGAKRVDHFRDSLFQNPGFKNHWIALKLVGTTSNRSAIGARIRVDFVENGKARSVYRNVDSGGSFGGNPLQQHIGIGSATEVISIQVLWPVTGKTQTFEKPKIDRTWKITEGVDSLQKS
jgi:tetratricopeptide (TPR) repeat protein